MSAFGRGMAPCEIVAEAVRRAGRDLADLSIAEQARLEEFALAFCDVPEGGAVRMVATANHDIITAMAHGLGVSVLEAG